MQHFIFYQPTYQGDNTFGSSDGLVLAVSIPIPIPFSISIAVVRLQL